MEGNNPFGKIPNEALRRFAPYEKRKLTNPGFEGVREITSEPEEDLRDTATFLRLTPYEKRKPEYPGFEGVREITSEPEEDLKDLLAFRPGAQYGGFSTHPEVVFDEKAAKLIDRAALDEAGKLIVAGAKALEQEFIPVHKFLQSGAQRQALLDYLAYLAYSEQYRMPGAIDIENRIADGIPLSPDDFTRLQSYLNAVEVFLN